MGLAVDWVWEATDVGGFREWNEGHGLDKPYFCDREGLLEDQEPQSNR